MHDPLAEGHGSSSWHLVQPAHHSLTAEIENLEPIGVLIYYFYIYIHIYIYTHV